MLGVEEARVIGESLRVHVSLTSLSLRNNKLGDEGVEALSVGLKESNSLKTLDLSNSHFLSTKFGPKGAMALASAIADNGSLTKLNVRANKIDYVGEEALRDAVKGRNGFVLDVPTTRSSVF